MLSLSIGDLHSDELEPVIESGGTPFLLVPIRRRDAIERARLRKDLYDALRRNCDSEKVFAYCLEDDSSNSKVWARMFAPAIGIPEDPATGSAAVALGGYL